MTAGYTGNAGVYDLTKQVSTGAQGWLDYASTSPVTPTQLVVTVEPPSSTTSGASFGLAVTAEDSLGNIGTGFTNNVTVTILADPSSGTLSGTTTVAAVSGVATFAGLSINKAGSGYTLQATTVGLSPAVTTAFAITPGSASKLIVTTQPPWKPVR